MTLSYHFSLTNLKFVAYTCSKRVLYIVGWLNFNLVIFKLILTLNNLKYSFTKLMRHHFIRLKSPIPSKLSKQRSSERLPMSAEDSGRRRMGRNTWSLSLMTRGRIKLPKSPDFFKITKPTVIDNRIQLVIKLRN